MHYSGSYKRCRHGNRHPYIPFGKVALLQGDSGDGKSKLMLSLAALLSEGAPLPFSDDEESYEPVTIIYQTTEDDADDTVVPRFNAAGGDSETAVGCTAVFLFQIAFKKS